ncbi:hypothetical protein P7228_09825 [Altererythrobacter arenosus]|uniref:ATP-grasp domain-containing protein n=1 Tax=Altererythrobacter arenosus TaxID=3032592 RepID=A0ABY8FT86_9SPHN|nr:hypothetical protein [Altererythrobacter sp. CAU 1644]WFL76296.1 hypothetical protein P7228_09825 [Altererythrobacter sp. CAU 1644]
MFSRLTRARRLLDFQSVLQRRRMLPIRAAFYDNLWRSAASDLGAEVEVARLGLIRIRRDGLVTHVQRSNLPLDDALTSLVISDKLFCYESFLARDLPVPRHAAFTLTELGQAEAFLARIGQAAVVKPLAGTGGGMGVTTGVIDKAGLHRAARYAAGFGPNLLIEEEVSGPSYRLLYLDGQFIDAIRRDPPSVTGDDKHSIGQLVGRENRRRLAPPVTALSPLRIDSDMKNTLARAGLSLAYRPAKGERLVVKGAVNENTASDNHSVKGIVHHDIVRRIGDLVQAMAIRFAGVDLIGGDLTRPLGECGSVINEVNVNPGIHHHMLVRDPAIAVPVPLLILEHLFEERTGVMMP